MCNHDFPISLSPSPTSHLLYYLLSGLNSIFKLANEDLEMIYYSMYNSSDLDIMKNKIQLPDMTWSVKDINKFLQHPPNPLTDDMQNAVQQQRN